MKRFSTFFLLIFAVVLLTYGTPISAEAADTQIYWASHNGIHRSLLDGSNVETLHSQQNYPQSITLDMATGKIYFNDLTTIYRSSFDGSNVEMLVTREEDFLQSIALDTTAGKIYWGQGSGKIKRANLNGTNVETIITNPDYADEINYRVADVALDVEAGKIYWTEFDSSPGSGKIKRANLNGTTIETLIEASRPEGFALDVEGGKIYWVEDPLIFIRRADLNGTNIEVILTDDQYIGDIALDVEAGKIYWTLNSLTDDPVDKIKRADLNSTDVRGTNVEIIASEIVRASGITLSISADATTRPVSTDKVVIPDANLAKAVRKALGLGSNASITKQAMQRLTNLNARESQIKNLTGLEHATQLTDLELYKNQIRNVSPLTGLTQLRRLGLDENKINDIRPLSGLTHLEGLYIGGNQINNSGVELLTKFKQLKWLSLYSNQISDIKPLANLTKLEGLWLTHNQIRDVSPLTGLANLKTLHIENNSILDISPLVELTKLEDLKLNGNPITDTSPLRTLKDRNPKLKVDIEIPPLSPVVHLDAAQRLPMYWVGATTGTLHRLVGDEVENIAPNVQNVTGIAVNVAEDKLYWTEKTSERTGRIRRTNLDGTNVKLVKNLTSVPYGIALDTVNGKLYLTNAWGKIQRLNVDGSNFQPNLITGLDTPTNLALDVTGGKVYWTETTEVSGRIRRANFNGSGVQNVATGLVPPLSLAVANGKIYWTEGTTENAGKLHRANLDGTNSELLETLPLAPTGIAVDTGRNSLYLTVPSGEIHRRDLDGSGDDPIVTGLATPSNIVLGITATTPVPTDASEPVTTPAVDAATDVNKDQKVNKTDLLLVVTALGEKPPANPNVDVNADGTVNIADVLLVIEALDDPVAAAAPSLGEIGISLDPALLTAQIDLLRAESDGSMKYENAIAFFQGLLASIRPTETRLLANYPNPFNPETWIPYHLANPSHVRITIYNIRGSIVRRLDLGHQREGYYTSQNRAAYWDGRNQLGELVASGIYFYTLSTGDFTTTRRMLIVK